MFRPPNNKNSRLPIRRRNPRRLTTTVHPPRPNMSVHLTLSRTRKIDLDVLHTRIQHGGNIQILPEVEALIADGLGLGVFGVVDDRHAEDRPAKHPRLIVEDIAAVRAQTRKKARIVSKVSIG